MELQAYLVRRVVGEEDHLVEVEGEETHPDPIELTSGMGWPSLGAPTSQPVPTIVGPTAPQTRKAGAGRARVLGSVVLAVMAHGDTVRLVVQIPMGRGDQPPEPIRRVHAAIAPARLEIATPPANGRMARKTGATPSAR